MELNEEEKQVVAELESSFEELAIDTMKVKSFIDVEHIKIAFDRAMKKVNEAQIESQLQ